MLIKSMFYESLYSVLDFLWFEPFIILAINELTYPSKQYTDYIQYYARFICTCGQWRQL